MASSDDIVPASADRDPEEEDQGAGDFDFTAKPGRSGKTIKGMYRYVCAGEIRMRRGLSFVCLECGLAQSCSTRASPSQFTVAVCNGLGHPYTVIVTVKLTLSRRDPELITLLLLQSSPPSCPSSTGPS